MGISLNHYLSHKNYQLTYHIKTYQSIDAPIWNEFITQSVNGTFLFYRDFMDYHADRFSDASLMVFNNNQLVCCVPANDKDNNFYSHQGLTYGGFVLLQGLTQHEIDEIVSTCLRFLKDNYHQIQLRLQPSFYNQYHDMVFNALTELGFESYDKFNNLHIDLEQPMAVSAKKTAGYRNGKFDDMRWVVNHDFASFWEQVLIPQLHARHHTQPVHTIHEMELLASRFPDYIQQYLVYQQGELLAGVTFFKKGNVAKSQYAAATMNGMKKSALDFLYIEAINDFKKSDIKVVDLGHVNEPDGSINRGLQRFKEELGAVNQPVIWSQYK